jgi:membrane peptidoglycan carboxypeptidase
MKRLSRGARLLRLALPFLIALYLAMAALSIHVFVIDRRIARELAPRSWRVPTIISSAANNRTREVARVYGTDWRPTPPVLLEQLPPHVADAFLAAEDVRFRRHFGVDPIGIARAAFTNIRAGGIAQGGSTIPQQIVKQRFLTNERTWRRKIIEGALAVAIDVRLTKDDLLELYLNDVYLGHHAGVPILGIDEASRLYFDKPPRALRLDEAALLAAMIRAPNRDTPEKRPDLTRARRNAILAVMHDQGWIGDDQYRAAIAHPVDVTRGALPESPYPFYLRALRADVVHAVGRRPVVAGGLTIVCEMDPAAQTAAEREARRGVQRLRERYRWIRSQSSKDPLQVAILSIDPRSGGVRALVGGSDFRRSPFDRTSQMRRQPGSAFKTFAYLAAIASKRATTATLLLDSPVKVELSNDEVWEPQNYDERFRGRVTLRESFERSLNVPTVRLTQAIGLRRVANTAEGFGFQHVEAVPAMPLGVGEVSMRELTTAYTAFPNLGERVEPFLLRPAEEARRGRRRRLRHAHTAARCRAPRHGHAPQALRPRLRSRQDRHDQRLSRRLVRRLHRGRRHDRLGRLRSRCAASTLVIRSRAADLGRLHECHPTHRIQSESAGRRDLPRHRSRIRHALARRLPRPDPRSFPGRHRSHPPLPGRHLRPTRPPHPLQRRPLRRAAGHHIRKVPPLGQRGRSQSPGGGRGDGKTAEIVQLS